MENKTWFYEGLLFEDKKNTAQMDKRYNVNQN